MTNSIQRRRTTPNARRIPQTEQAAKCYDLKLKGWTERQIAAELGVSLGTVQNRLKLAIKEKILPAATEYRALLMDRLEDLYSKAYTKIEKGDPQAINSARNIIMDMYEVAGLKVAQVDMTVVAAVTQDPELNAALSAYSDPPPDDMSVIEGEYFE